MLKPWRALGNAPVEARSRGAASVACLRSAKSRVALVLVVASMLMVRTMRALLTQDLGFNPRGVIAAALPRPARPPLDANALALMHEAEVQVVEAVTQLPASWLLAWVGARWG